MGSHLSPPINPAQLLLNACSTAVCTVARTGTTLPPPAPPSVQPITGGHHVSRCGAVTCTHATPPARVHPSMAKCS